MVFVARRLHGDHDRYCGHGIRTGLSTCSLLTLTLCAVVTFVTLPHRQIGGFFALEDLCDVRQHRTLTESVSWVIRSQDADLEAVERCI
jgi:hypothetical protein